MLIVRTDISKDFFLIDFMFMHELTAAVAILTVL